MLGEVAEAVRGRRRQAEQVGDRVDGDQRRRPGHEAAQGGRRNEVGDRAEAKRADHELDRADQHGHRERERDVGRRADRGERRQGREQGKRVRVGRPRDDVPARAEQCRDDARNDRGVEAVFGRQPGKRREGDPLRQDEQRAEEARDQVGAHARAIDPTDPRPEDARSELVHCARLSCPRCRPSTPRRRPGWRVTAMGRPRSLSPRSERARGSAHRSGWPRTRASRRCRRGRPRRRALRPGGARRASRFGARRARVLQGDRSRTAASRRR